MKDDMKRVTKDLRGWTVRVPKGKAEDLLKGVTARARMTGSEVLVLKSDLVFGSDHIKAAMYHARKAMDEDRNASDSLAMETLLYSSGERQLSSAISKMSVDSDTEEVAVFSLGGAALTPEIDWKEMPGILERVDEARLTRFGISARELETVSAGRGIELVLEKVAAVDILKK